MRQRLLLRLSLLILCLSLITHAQTDPVEDRTRVSARNELNQGVQDYKQARYESATQHFREAAKLDPDLVVAHLYLATALAQQYVPGIDTPDNVKLAEEAIDAYKQVLAADPKNVVPLKGLAYLEMNMKKFEEAKSDYRQAAQVDPRDPEAFYSVGVIDWTQAYKHRAEERANRGLPMNDPPSTFRSFCPKLRDDNLPLVEDGMEMLTKAIELRPDYDDAMAYLNLLFRERADIQCNDKAARANDERQANAWADRAMEIRKRKFEKSTQGQQPPQNQ